MPTQTFTPTQTFSATGSYQENGDVSDATVLQDVAEKTMSNVAFLLGSASGATPQAVRKIATVDDLAALKAIAAADRRDRDYCVLDSNKRIYQFDSASAATGDDYAVVTPAAGTGRWILDASAVPATTTKTWCRLGIEALNEFDITRGARGIALGISTWDASCTGTSIFVTFDQQDFNPDDVVTSVTIIGIHGNNADSMTATLYKYLSTEGDTAIVPTALGNGTKTASTAAYSFNVNTTDTTAPSGTTSISYAVKIDLTVTTGISIYKVSLNGTRAYITQ